MLLLGRSSAHDLHLHVLRVMAVLTLSAENSATDARQKQALRSFV